jgi:hypothetical protein
MWHDSPVFCWKTIKLANVLNQEFEDTKWVMRIRNRKRQTTQWLKAKSQKDKQRYKNITTRNTKDGATWTLLKHGGKRRCLLRISSCSTSDTRYATLFASPVTCHEWGTDRKVIKTDETCPLWFMTRIFCNG